MSHSSSSSSPAPAPQQEIPEYPSNSKRILIMSAVFLAVFLITLDQNIISTAIPRITDEFDSLDDVGWYGSAYLLTTCSFQLLMGKIYKHYPAKPVFLIGCLLFEIGSAICGAAPSSAAFIVGRAIAGVGSSGIYAGVMVILFHAVPLQQRPIYQGMFAATFALASVVGPLAGGALTDKVTWRWCFYINLPIGGASMLVTALILRLPNQKLDAAAKGWLGKIKQLDPIGGLTFFPGIVCLILALEWGGTKYAWNSARIIVLLVLFVIFVTIFIGIQIWKDEAATVPPRLVKGRNMLGAIIFGFFNCSSMMVMLYYLPIWFQAVKGSSAISSGVMLLPTILAMVTGAIVSGLIISRVGYYIPFLYMSSILTPIGAGLMVLFTPSTSSGQWIGFQILFGVGLGVGIQQPLNIVQTVLERSDIAVGSALMMFSRFLGAAVFLPVAQSIFLNGLITNLANLPGIDASAVANDGATALRNLVSGSRLQTLLTDYNGAIVEVFYLVVALSGFTIFGTVMAQSISLKERAAQQAGGSKVNEKPSSDSAA